MMYITYGDLLSILKKENRDDKIIVSIAKSGENKRFVNPIANKPIDVVGEWIDYVSNYIEEDDLGMELICYSSSLKKNVGICYITKRENTIVVCIGEIIDSIDIE